MRNVHGLWRGRSRRTPDPDVAQLLDDIRALRLTLTADLSAAASALEADEPEIARDIICADRVEVRRLAGGVSAPPTSAPARRRRVLLALPAIPLIGALAMTGAAALSSHHSPDASTRPAAASSAAVRSPGHISHTAATTFHHLVRVVNQHREESQVVEIAEHLHDQLSAMIATSSNSPTRLNEVQHLLSLEQTLLEGQHGSGAALALAASRQLTQLLQSTAHAVGLPSPPVPVLLAPTKAPTRTATSAPATPATKVAKPTSPSAPTPRSPKPKTSPSKHHHRSNHHHHHLHLLGPGLIDNTL